jgi:hypothetical protein
MKEKPTKNNMNVNVFKKHDDKRKKGKFRRDSVNEKSFRSNNIRGIKDKG